MVEERAREDSASVGATRPERLPFLIFGNQLTRYPLVARSSTDTTRGTHLLVVVAASHASNATRKHTHTHARTHA